MKNHIRRREFITLLGGATAAAWPRVAAAQQDGRVRRVGVLSGYAADEGQSLIAAFQQTLRSLGWIEGRNLRLEVRWATAADPALMQAYAEELVNLKSDAIVVNGGRALTAAQRETREIPVVFALLTDPVRSGYVQSLARPGGNVTGFTTFEGPVLPKLTEALKELAPRIARVGILISPDNLAFDMESRALETAAPMLGVSPEAVPVRTASEIERAIEAFAGAPNGGLLVPLDVAISTHRAFIVGLASRHRLPAAYADRDYVGVGGLMSYGINRADAYRRTATYVDRILRGEKPANLPVQQPTKFHFALNLKAAKALGLDVPTATLLRADEVIE